MLSRRSTSVSAAATFRDGEAAGPGRGTFDPNSGAVVSGPPPTGLTSRRVVETGGSVYAILTYLTLKSMCWPAR